MTCAEFRMCNLRGVAGILALTRAERSAAAQHWSRCFACRDWTVGLTFGMTAKEAAEVKAIKAADAADPETFKLDPAELGKYDLDEGTATDGATDTARLRHKRDVENP